MLLIRLNHCVAKTNQTSAEICNDGSLIEHFGHKNQALVHDQQISHPLLLHYCSLCFELIDAFLNNVNDRVWWESLQRDFPFDEEGQIIKSTSFDSRYYRAKTIEAKTTYDVAREIEQFLRYLDQHDPNEFISCDLDALVVFLGALQRMLHAYVVHKPLALDTNSMLDKCKENLATFAVGIGILKSLSIGCKIIKLEATTLNLRGKLNSRVQQGLTFNRPTGRSQPVRLADYLRPIAGLRAV
jgi:hypothetical protein